MATLPEASVEINENAGAFGGGTGYLVVMACVAQNADFVPRVIASTTGLLAQYLYSPGIDYCSLHFAATRKPIIFIGLPIATAGTVGSLDVSGVVGTSVITVTTGAAGSMEQVSAILKVVTGGTIGTDQIVLSLSLDNGVSYQTVRLGTASSYTIPNVNQVIHFAAGTLIAADQATWLSTAPMWGSTAIASARAALAGQQNLARSWMVIGDLPNSTFAGYVTTDVNNYETTNQRFAYARAQVSDLYPLALKSKVAVETLTFAASGETITRSAGSWLTDGFAVGQTVAFTGTASNNMSFTISALSATVMTVSAGVVNEGPINSNIVKAVQVETLAAWVSAQTAAFATVDAQKRIDLGLGRGTVQSPITGYSFRRPVQWAASIREYQHDLQIPCWRKADGPLDGFSITDANGNTVEFDERYDGGALAGRFTCFRSYGNGPLGAFIALSLTRDSEGALLSRTHNMAVADLAMTVVQAQTENAIGQVLRLTSSGTGTPASLSLIEQRVNTALQVNLLQNFAEGPRASSAVWSASRTDILNVPGATLNGTLALELNGTLENIATTVVIQTAGA